MERMGATEQVLQHVNANMSTLSQQFSGFMNTWTPSVATTRRTRHT